MPSFAGALDMRLVRFISCDRELHSPLAGEPVQMMALLPCSTPRMPACLCACCASVPFFSMPQAQAADLLPLCC